MAPRNMVSRILPASMALVALSAVLCFIAVSLMGSSQSTETVLAFKQPNKRAEWAKCAKMAKSFKGTRPDQRKITESEKLEAKQCLHLVKMAKAMKAKDMKLNKAEPACTCCEFAGCPCCQPAMESGVTKLEHMPKQLHFSKSELVHPKHPYFHGQKKYMAKLAKKAAEKAGKLHEAKPFHFDPKTAFNF